MEILELKNPITEMKKSLDGPISRYKLAKEKFSKFEEKSVEIMQSEEQWEKQNEEKLTECQSNMGEI